MALKVSKVKVWAASIEDKPGGLAKVLDALAGAGANLECAIARRSPDKPGQGVVYVTPVKGKKVEAAAASVGLSAAGIATLKVEGSDKPGIGASIARAVADAGINARGLSAAVIGRQFVAYIGFDSDADADRAAKAIRKIKA